jgi:hypothetical protein
MAVPMAVPARAGVPSMSETDEPSQVIHKHIDIHTCTCRYHQEFF